MKKSLAKMSMLDLVAELNVLRTAAGLDPVNGLYGTSKQAAIIKIHNAQRGIF